MEAIEYYYPALDHYFVTASATEIQALDSGKFPGWHRTGYQFTAYAATPISPPLSPVCRFYGRPEAGLDSHFYSASPAECAAVAVKFAASWQFESGDVFQVRLPDLGTGACPQGTIAIYRLFNGRIDANHRYTSDAGVRQQMLFAGYVAEGYGSPSVAFCAAADAFNPGVPPVVPPIVPPVTGPSASFVVIPIAPDTFDFISSASAVSGTSIVSYAWDFGDGNTSGGATSSHGYTISGTYPVVLTVTDSKGVSAKTAKDVTATVVKPPGPPAPVGPRGSWSKYPTRPSAGTEAVYQSWYNLAYDTKRDLFYGLSWGAVLSAFDPTKGVWRPLTPDLGSGAAVHNRTTAYDPINDRVWIATGTGFQLAGVNYYDPNTAQWVNHPMAGRLPGTEAAMIFDPVGKRFIVFGGWGLLKVHTFDLSPVASSMVDANLLGGPAFSTAATKMTAWRSALDSKRNRIVYVDSDGSLWALPLALSGWQHLGTTGGPPPIMTQFVYDVVNDALVGWSASPVIAPGDPAPGTTRETWLLPLSTLAWSKAADVVTGDTVPVMTTYVGYAMAYDPARAQTLLHTAA
ncbi:MAG: PKD domain-containing protein, partial [Anaerolineaceae bacterium]